MGYYDPHYETIYRAAPGATWSKRERHLPKARSIDEGAMKLGILPHYPVARLVPFAKQLPRHDSSLTATTLKYDYTQSVSLTDRVSVPDMSKTVGRPEAVLGISTINPDYRPNFSVVWKPLARNLDFQRTSGRTVPKTALQDLVYDHISYSQIRPSVPSPTLKRPKPDLLNSPFPRFMRNLTSWQSLSRLPETVQVERKGAQSRRTQQRNCSSVYCVQETHTSASPEKRSEGGREAALTGRSSSLLFSSN